jgi:creatinine amidohydrolase
MEYLVTGVTADDVRKQASRVAVLPVGSFEQHGTLLPLVTDTVVACLIAARVSQDHGLFLLPPVTMSCSHEHASIGPAVSISARTLIAIVADIRESLEAAGVERLVIVNGHGGNYVLSNVVQEANVTDHRATLFPARHDWDTARAAAGLATTAHDDMHAGELEVSLLLYATPDLVRDSYRTADVPAGPRPHLLVTGMRGYTASGVIGRPSLGTAAKGRSILDSLAQSFKDHLALLT